MLFCITASLQIKKSLTQTIKSGLDIETEGTPIKNGYGWSTDHLGSKRTLRAF